jgi:anti-sigma factor RsiW
MKERREQAELLQQYILGELSEAEQQQVEERYFAEPEWAQELIAERAELLDAWADDTLPSAQRVQLERQIQKLPALRRQAEFALSLRDWFATPQSATP